MGKGQLLPLPLLTPTLQKNQFQRGKLELSRCQKLWFQLQSPLKLQFAVCGFFFFLKQSNPLILEVITTPTDALSHWWSEGRTKTSFFHPHLPL